MHSTLRLSENYREIYQVNLQKDKKTAILINVFAVLAMIAMLVLGHFMVPVDHMFDFEQGMGRYFLRFAVLLGGYAVYMILHELTHGAVMKLYGAKTLRFGFTGMYAYCGSLDDYFDKKAYIQIALAPLVVWGVILTVILLLVSADWFWPVYFIQVGNIAGAAGDIFVTLKFSKMPTDIYVNDTGIEMKVFSAKVSD